MIACFPFVFSQILPLLTYAGLLVVPVGAIVFAEHQIFPRIGYTRYWSSYRELSFSTPAIASWALGLIFGFGLNTLDVMSFFYLFIPTWVFTIIVYTLLAARYGAKNKYPEAKRQEKIQNENIVSYQKQKAEQEPVPVKDNTILTKVIKTVALTTLFIILIFACIVLFQSGDELDYTQNREMFYRYAFIGTIIYFTTAYWALRRGKTKKD
jgi:quinol-cytochrome oxidoreductase complex cytochrome b subunit